MSVELFAQQNKRLRELPLWGLLASDHGPAVLALLETHLLSQERTQTRQVLIERLSEDLRRLRVLGIEIEQKPDKLLQQWVSKGYLRTRLRADSVEEEYELTQDADRAIRFVQSLRAPRVAATESRLSVVMSQLIELDQKTQDSPESRIQALMAERARIDEEIGRVEAGEWQPMEDDRALERVREILALTEDLIADFRRVRDSFEELHLRLRAQIIESEGGRGDVLDEVFSGVDKIGESESGRSFNAFYALLVDQERNTALNTALTQLLKREFVQRLSLADRDMLRRLSRTMQIQAGAVRNVMLGFSRSLSEFVRSPEYRDLKVLSAVIKEAERAALQIKEHIKPQDKVGMNLDLTSARIASITETRLYDHAMAFSGEGMREDVSDASLDDLADLFAKGDIDFTSLKRNVDAVLEELPQATISQVLSAYPPRQGLGSILGLISLAEQDGVVLHAEKETVEWTGLDGVLRAAEINLAYFVRKDDNGN